MSKMDDMRAMREARFGQAAPRTTGKAAAPTAPTAPKRADPSGPPETSDTSDTSDTTEARLCGHRAISGRSCTREHGHEAKSHRYS